ncbi:putative 2OG-Fe(II) oxygenase family oxidoreductase [Aspergillus costaricaensis CBS 115574]|uniref:2OG-Fe(II) oxygenase family oxidoreductase n=1 Tax=Aspergillus costaricaensis CBS 115574 TaxID=1448317 RepID=A0ACD1IC57_9EURO|nr:putative 2OG-Fe(II) oxygenase family oxidoreductase [Aspergillus costaricaensis CBS 115574]RAK87876.1 putative 2OG-Fe(II) oxygenase family oxidoreductase [Aspergillus costaricaensis CBS 115574]
MASALPEAPLSVIDWGKLKSGDPDEGKRLLAACEGQGFFYLDLSSAPAFLQDHKSVLRFMEDYFHQDLTEKMKDDRRSDTHGYEPVATSTGAMMSLPDYYESLKASRDELHSDSSALAPGIRKHKDLFHRFGNMAHDVSMVVLQELDRQLGLGGESASFKEFHREEAESLTTLSMFRYPKQETLDLGVGHNKHTDIGTLTFLLCEQWGLQVLSKDPAGWRFVAPREGHAVINVGDTLRFLSGNRFRSAVHRVIPTQRLQHEDRYSIAYFLRAANDTIFTDSTGRNISAKQWHDEKFDVFRETHEEQERQPILTGGMERQEAIVV